MRIWTCAGAWLLCCALTATSAPADAEQSPFGDYQGTLTKGDNQRPLCAQVIDWGKGEFQANLLAEFDRRIPALAVWHGQRHGEVVVFPEGGRIEGGVFTGSLAGEVAGRFELKRVVRLSPTLGLKAPPGAVELLPGGRMNAWLAGGQRPWIIDLMKVARGENRAAYLRARVWSPAAQPARLEIGSDDSVKAWVNGRLVHSNAVARPVSEWQDKVDVDLRQGWNTVMLKVCQGGGGWGACARVVGRDGQSLPGLKFEPMPVLAQGRELADYQDSERGAVIAWQFSGPYQQEGASGPTALLDVPFPPESKPGSAKWKTINRKPKGILDWKRLPDGAVEVTPGAGSRRTQQTFASCNLHIEFKTPFRPTARGQARGNSGVYIQGRYEVQVLDSYGLEGKANECGGLYKHTAPLVNMCAPPLQWQTYDIEFIAPRQRPGGGIDKAVITVRHNGVLIHDHVKLPNSNRPDRLTPGPILLQDHGNPVQYRNIWVLPLEHQ